MILLMLIKFSEAGKDTPFLHLSISGTISLKIFMRFSFIQNITRIFVGQIVTKKRKIGTEERDSLDQFQNRLELFKIGSYLSCYACHNQTPD